jgi:Uma2 family endonuclease
MSGGRTVPTLTKLGPADHGRPMSLDDFMSGDYRGGYRYELIDGKLYVTPAPNMPENRVELWIVMKLWNYAQAKPGVINFVGHKARVFVPDRTGVTNPEPDAAAYRDFPVDAPFDAVRWQDVSPVLVVEILSPDDPNKDLVRNVELYLQVPSIREYWAFDTRPEGAERPTLRVHRRGKSGWRVIDVAFGETYTTRLLPGFELVVDPRR